MCSTQRRAAADVASLRRPALPVGIGQADAMDGLTPAPGTVAGRTAGGLPLNGRPQAGLPHRGWEPDGDGTMARSFVSLRRGAGPGSCATAAPRPSRRTMSRQAAGIFCRPLAVSPPLGWPRHAPPARPGGAKTACARRLPSWVHCGIRAGSAPAARHSSAAAYALGSSTVPSAAPSMTPAASASKSARPGAICCSSATQLAVSSGSASARHGARAGPPGAVLRPPAHLPGLA